MTEVDVHQIFADPRVAELAEAVAEGDAARVQRLAQGTNLQAHGDKNVTLLEWAVLNQSPKGLNALLVAGADPAETGIDGSNVVHLAAMAKDPIYLQTLLAHGAHPDTPHSQTGAAPLSAALMGERPIQFKALLAAGANPNHVDRQGNSALHVAGKINESGHALDLLLAGADPVARNTQGATFQRYLNMTPVKLLTDESRRDREAVQAWLREHGIPVEGD